MSDYVYLQGSENVQRAGHTMSDAADRISRSMSHFEFQIDRLERILTETVDRLEELARVNRAEVPE
jgi:DNA-binding HxlR family transcriptional regulator